MACLALFGGCGGAGARHRSAPSHAPSDQQVVALSFSSVTPMRFEHVPPPSSGAPGIGPASMAFVSPRLGFLATTGGAFEQPKVGYIRPSASAEIEETLDGGASWHVLLRVPHVVFDDIAFADRDVGFATGNVVYGHGCCEAPAPDPVGFSTRDGGRHWLRVRLPPSLVGARLDLVAPGAWYATGNSLLFSSDQGRRWVHRALPRGVSRFGRAVTAFPDARIGYAAGAARCGERLFKTLNGGRSWTPLPGTCETAYSSLDFLTARTGWAVRGYPSPGHEASIYARARVTFTNDGGVRWTTVSRGGRWPIDTTLLFTNRADGWAVSRSVAQGFAYAETHRTTDGGRRWRTVDLTPSAVAGPASAWEGSTGGAHAGGALVLTTDGARTRALVIKPQYVGARTVELATHSMLVIESAVGTLRSVDQGAIWRPVPALSPRAAARALGQPDYLGAAPRGPDGLEGSERGGSLRVSDDGGRSWSARTTPFVGSTAGEAAFADPEHGLVAGGEGTAFEPSGQTPVFATDDGGRIWSRVPPPGDVGSGRDVRLGPGVIAIVDSPELYLSVDQGERWRAVAIGDDGTCAVSRPRPSAIWVLCGSWEQERRGASLLLRSDDGGVSWRELRSPLRLDPRVIVALNGEQAWASDDTALWHTTDGGRVWHEIWPFVPSLSALPIQKGGTARSDVSEE